MMKSVVPVAMVFLLGLSLVVAVALGPGADPTGATTSNARTFEFTYLVKIKDIPPNAGKLEVWIPYPTSNGAQEIYDMKIDSLYPTRVAKDSEQGNSILYLTVDNPKESTLEIAMRFKVRRKELLRKDFSAVAARASYEDSELQPFLRPDRLVPIDGKIKSLAQEVIKGKQTDLEKARAIYDYTVSNLKYDKSGTGWGRGDIYYACDIKQGNCTDFHAVFIGFARAVGIPARFEIGFPLPEQRGAAEIAGYHCWAHFYLKPYGWIPVDASEAFKNPAKRDYFFGALDENRVLFSQGRDLRLNPPQKGEPLNFFVYPYVELNGKVFTSVEKKFLFRDIDADGIHAVSSGAK